MRAGRGRSAREAVLITTHVAGHISRTLAPNVGPPPPYLSFNVS